jgi:sugar transferase (PEP-CTERM/EpsH1 system associated)
VNAQQEGPLVVHIIFALGTGGLENGLVNIINRTPPGRYRHAVVCLTEAQEFAKRITAPGVQIVELHKKPGHDPAMYWRLWRALRKLAPTIVHSRNLAALETQVLGIVMPGIKRVHGEHGRDVHDIDGSYWKYRMLRKLLRPLIHRYIAVSRDLAQWLSGSIGVPNNRIYQIYNGVDQVRFIPSPKRATTLLSQGFVSAEGGVVLGSVGRLAEVKNQAILLEAMNILMKTRPEWRCKLRLVLVGDGPCRKPLEQRVVELGLDDLVWMTGDREDIPQLLQAMDIFVLPSLAEGISNTLLEAMATGLPVVATRVGGNPELIEHGENGFLVPVSDPRALADTLQGLIESRELRIRMGDNGLQKIRQGFDWDSTVEAYLGVYDELLGIVDTGGLGHKAAPQGREARVG